MRSEEVDGGCPVGPDTTFRASRSHLALGSGLMTLPAAGAVLQMRERLQRLGREPSNTNYAGGNTSCRAVVDDAVTNSLAEAALREGVWRRSRDPGTGTAIILSKPTLRSSSCGRQPPSVGKG